MDANRFDRLVSSFASRATRRSALRVLIGGGLGAGLANVGLGRIAAGPPHGDAAEKQRKRGPKRNAFGCVDVGDACNNAGQCCSGICRGKPGKRTCRAHDASTCRAGQRSTDCAAGGPATFPCTAASGQPGVCQTTTGKAAYCAVRQACRRCTKDADCRAEFGPNAACLRCQADCSTTGGTACAGAIAP